MTHTTSPFPQAEKHITVVPVDAPVRLTEKEQIFHDGLIEYLQWALPIAMLEVCRMPAHALDPLRAKASAAIGSRGDALQFQKTKHTAEASTQLTLGLAYLALMTPGGLTRFGVHACAMPHANCPANTGECDPTESTT